MRKRILPKVILSVVTVTVYVLLSVNPILLVALIPSLFAFFIGRVVYTYGIFGISEDIIHQYTSDLIEQDKYDMDVNYYEEMELDIIDYFFHFWWWSVDKCFKSEYKELLKGYKSNNLKFFRLIRKSTR